MSKAKVEPEVAAVNKDGTPDMRIKENRDNPQLVQDANERKEEHTIPGEGLNKDGTPDLRLKENRDNPQVIAERNGK